MKMAEVNTLSLPLYYCFLDQNPNSGTADLLTTGLHKYSTRKKKKKNVSPFFNGGFGISLVVTQKAYTYITCSSVSSV